MSEVEGFGDPKHGTDRKGFPEALKDGDNFHRCLPPILSQRETGKYVRDHTCHYGYGIKTRSGKDIMNPFYCVEEGKFISGKFVVLERCPECDEIARIKAEVEAIEADMKRAHASDADISAATKSQAEWLRKHNRDFKYYVNVKSADGRYFTVKYPSKKVWKVIESLIQKYKSQRIPIDAIAASQGLWFRITRSGKGFGTDYAVEVVMEDVIINGQVVEGAQKPKLGSLTAEDAKKAGENCLDLGDVGIRRLSREQVARLVSSGGDPTVIAAIFQASDDTASVRQERPEPEERPEPTPAPAGSPEPLRAAPIIQPAPAPAETVKASAPPVTAPPAAGNAAQMELVRQARALMEQARAMGVPAPTATQPTPTPAPVVQPTPTPPPQPKPAPAPTPTPTPTPASVQGEEAFLSQFDFGGE